MSHSMGINGSTNNAPTQAEIEAAEEVDRLATLDREFVKSKDNIESKPESEDTSRRVVCYNRNCKDYRVERPWDSACSCRRTKVKGAGDRYPF